MSPKNILVTGATGQQGRALIAALRPKQDTEAKFHALALTRSSTGPIAKQFALEKHVTVVEGNMMSIESIRKVFEDAKENGGVWGVYCVVAFPGLGAKADGEEQQGKASRWVFQPMQSPLTESFRQWQTSRQNLECLFSSTLQLNGEATNLTMSKWALQKPR
jgi:NAD(P)-dependent dehydrogenase (short-subunit alcohol dehydrogenase family)